MPNIYDPEQQNSIDVVNTDISHEVSPFIEGADGMVLDANVLSVLQNTRVVGDEKWFQYYKCLEQYLYKRHPTFKPIQFTLDVQEDSVTGVSHYTINPDPSVKKKQKTYTSKCLELIPGIIGSVLGATLAGIIKIYFGSN
jgi:hypothetical protein